MIIGQTIYQLAVTFTLYFAGARILQYDVVEDPNLQVQLDTIVFNTFVWMQIFNEFNNRRLDNNFNIFEGMLKNYWFIGINCLMVGGQILIIFVGDVALKVTRISGPQWAICILCAIFCVPWAVVLRCIPDRHFQVVIDVYTTVCMSIWNPFAKAMRFTFSPVGKMFKASWAPVKRFSNRLAARSRKKDTENDAAATADESEMKRTDDEEAQPAKSVEEKEEKAADQSAAASAPPITLTAPN